MRLMCEEDARAQCAPQQQPDVAVVEQVGVVEYYNGHSAKSQLQHWRTPEESRNDTDGVDLNTGAADSEAGAATVNMPGQDVTDMELCTDKVLSKGRILQELTKAVKLVSLSRMSSGGWLCWE